MDENFNLRGRVIEMTFPVFEGKVAIVTGTAMGMGLATQNFLQKAKVVVAELTKKKDK